MLQAIYPEIYEQGMLSWGLGILIRAVVLFVSSKFLNGVWVRSFFDAVLVAIIIYTLNWTVGEFLQDLAPSWLNVWTLGLVNLSIDAVILLATARIFNGFSLDSISWGFLLAFVLTLFS